MAITAIPSPNRPIRPFEPEAINHVILVNGNSYVSLHGAGIFTPVLAEARIYHSEYAANCALAQFRGYLAGKEVEVLPLQMTLVKPKGKKRG